MGEDNGVDISVSLRRRLNNLMEDIRDIRDQGKKASNESHQVLLFKGMYNTVDALYERYCTLYDELCDLMEDDGSSVANSNDHLARATTKRYLHEAHALMLSLQNEPQPGTSTSGNATVSFSGSRARAKLPTIALPSFSGTIAEWPRFRDLFESLVMGDDELRDIDRFHYLVASLHDPAASVVVNLPITEDNFKIAWQSLKDVYDNQRLLASTYLDEILEAKMLERKPSTRILSERIALLSKTIAAFKQLNIPDGREFIFFHLACKGLDADTRIAFENANSLQFPTFNVLIEFLRKRCAASELALTSKPNSVNNRMQSVPKVSTNLPFSGKSVLLSNQGQNNYKEPVRFESRDHHTNTKTPYKPVNAFTSKPNGNVSTTCFICGDQHLLTNCYKFTSASTDTRHSLLNGWKGCRNCLHSQHQTRTCPSKFRCRFCKNKHHSLLCSVPPQKSAYTTNRYNKSFSSESSGSTQSSNNDKKSHEFNRNTSLNSTTSYQMDIFLGTAVCFIGRSIPTYPIRLVIDSGSHLSFISRDCASRIGLNIEPYNADILGIGETPLVGFKGQAKCTLSPQRSRFPTLATSVVVVDKITAPLPGLTTPQEMWKPFLEYDLADPEFWVSKPVDLLLGCDLFSEILTGQIITVTPNMPKLLGTIFGFAVLGRLKDLSEAAQLCCLNSFAPYEPKSLDYDLQRFWLLEEPPVAQMLSPDEQRCEQIFCDTHYRLPSGRFGVRLPFKDKHPKFIGSRTVALRRLTHLESKLTRNPVLKEKYHDFLKEYLELGHMSRATRPGQFYIPHHCVTKGEGMNMKVRVVFDAAARTPSGSLNDALLVGPKLQTNQVTILLGFRLHKFAFTADAVKMYRQIEVHPDDRPFQCILWRFDSEQPVEEYELNTLAYGTSCAPYEALRVIRQLVHDDGDAFPLASKVLLEDMYIDDIATGASSLPKALTILQQIIALLAKGGFALSKWAANHPELLAAGLRTDNAVNSNSEPVSLQSSEDELSIKILGLQWDPRSDELSYMINPPPAVCTKRGVLSAVAKIYDPLGYLGPAVVLAKQIVQQAWKLQLDWDDQFPTSLKAEWIDIIYQLPELAQIRLPRWIAPAQTTSTSIVIFGDASERAYCAAAYLRTVDPGGTQSHLLMAKTKLAPVKPVSIPRLELCAALLAVRLWQSLQPFCQRFREMPQVFFFSDSTVVLAWLQTPAYKLKTFVANRVAKIRELSGTASWNHVASSDNPSDLGSRGLLPSQLLKCSLWFHGPQWLLKDPYDWPRMLCISPKVMPELKQTVINSSCMVTSIYTPILDWFNRFSSYNKLIRSLAYALRFITIVRKEGQRGRGPLTLSEIRHANQVAVKLVQAHAFFNSSSPVMNITSIPKDLLSLNPFFDKGGTLLVGGRLRHSEVSWSCKHPMILPYKGHFTKILIEHYHRILLHPGPTILLAVLRTKYWILNARNSVRHLSRQCVKCRKMTAVSNHPLMGDLPKCRFREGRAFLHVGTDFAGPFTIRESLRRKAPQFKSYLCIFVCLSTKALHLELVSDLSTAAFRATLNRFIGRRGMPEKIYSDNGTNYIGASNQLKEMYTWLRQQDNQDSLKTLGAQREIEWVFTPPHAPFFGGIWEAGVKSVKRLLRSVYDSNIMTFEELTTLFIEIEAILNSRPLCPMSNEANDLTFLSPGHFLIGSPLLAVPQPSLIEHPQNCLSRWEIICQKAQHFWQRWKKEYLTSLQERTKWKLPSYNLCIGDLVLIVDEQSPRCHWPLARVLQIHPGPDNVVRVATVKTHSSTLKRPTGKLIPLFPPTSPIHTNEASNENL